VTVGGRQVDKRLLADVAVDTSFEAVERLWAAEELDERAHRNAFSALFAVASDSECT
jgi:hypothetical protein